MKEIHNIRVTKMTREQAAKLAYQEMNKFPELKDWHLRFTTSEKVPFVGLCSYKDKCIILNAHHIDTHPDIEVIDTIKHELAHALLTPFHGHNEVWKAKARELGASPTANCSMALSPDIIDAIRSGADVKVEFEEEIIRRPKYEITRLQDRCDICHKVAVVKTESLIVIPDLTSPNKKFITYECGHTV